MDSIFKRWKEYVQEKKLFYEIREEEISEIEFARNNDLDPIYWCWNCKYSDCEIH